MRRRGVPGHEAAPVVADEVEPVGAERVGEAHDVGDEVVDAVLVEIARPRVACVPALVGGHGAVSGARRASRPA